ncbi:C45 family peptidase [bacterium]|nr:C45 family peptidase [bacterium]
MSDIAAIVPERRFLFVGNDQEMGFSQGRLFKGLVDDVLTSFKSIELLPMGLFKIVPTSFLKWGFGKIGKKFLGYHASHLKEKHSHWYDWLNGFAEGSELSFEFVYGIAVLELLTSELPYYPVMGCTSLALVANDGPLLAYNHDYPQSFGAFTFIKESRPKNKLASLSVSYPLIPGSIAGINEKGLALSINHAFEQGIKKDNEGLFVTWLLQDCLDTCSTAEEARKKILKTPVSNGSMISMMDKNGNTDVVEVSSRSNMLRHSNCAYRVTFNKYQVHEMEKNELPLKTRGSKMFRGEFVHRSNWERQSRFDTLFDKNKKYSEADVMALMADHAGAEGNMNTICRHHVLTSETVASVIMRPHQKSMKVAFGHPCTTPYKEYTLI